MGAVCQSRSNGSMGVNPKNGSNANFNSGANPVHIGRNDANLYNRTVWSQNHPMEKRLDYHVGTSGKIPAYVSGMTPAL